MTEKKINLVGLSPEIMRELFILRGEKAFRAKQVINWLYQKGALDFDQMSNLSLQFRQALKAEFKLGDFKIISQIASADNQTVKFLFQLKDQNIIETVLMNFFEGEELLRQTLCLSTQVGCAMGCKFCASGQAGFVRNLKSKELVEQLWRVNCFLPPEKRVSNLVFMGIGESLLNYEEVIKAVEFIHPAEIYKFGARHITISTCGIIPGILRLAEEPLAVRLAISLNAADDQLRSRLMPINKKYPLKELLETCRLYQEKARRRITFEYVMIKDLNDSPRDARQLVKILKRISCLINLIPLNPVKEFKGESSPPERIKRFKEILEESGISVALRKEMGSEIAAACGQLRINYPGEQLC